MSYTLSVVKCESNLKLQKSDLNFFKNYFINSSQFATNKKFSEISPSIVQCVSPRFYLPQAFFIGLFRNLSKKSFSFSCRDSFMNSTKILFGNFFIDRPCKNSFEDSFRNFIRNSLRTCPNYLPQIPPWLLSQFLARILPSISS